METLRQTIGSNSDHLYFGTIWIPGVTQPQVRISSVLSSTLSVPVNTALKPEQLVLQLGYVDDDYGGNGYTRHDDGTENQCAGFGPAYVIVTVRRFGSPAPQAPLAPFDLIWTASDANAMPLNAMWGQQILHQRNPNFPAPPGLTVCSTPWVSPCTTQAPTRDNSSPPNSWYCKTLGGPFPGHANWGAGTYTGTLAWESHSSEIGDDDYSINMTTSGNAGATEHRPEGLHIEFDADQTVDHFGSSWWNRLRSAVDNGDADARAVLDGYFAIATGVVGLDCTHDCSGELNPVFTIAIESSNGAGDETWAIFVRNSGDEGGCSSDTHFLPLLGPTYTFRLPWPLGATGVTVDTDGSQFETSGPSTPPQVTLTQGQGVDFTVTVGTSNSDMLFDGSLHLVWQGAVPRATSRGAHLPVVRGRDLREMPMPPMTAAQRTTYRRLVGSAAPAMHLLKVDVHTTPIRRASIMRFPLGGLPRVRSVYDPMKIARDRKRIAALQTIFNGAVPGSPNMPRITSP